MAVVLAGYLGALSATPAGRGLTLVPHLASSHAEGHLRAPRLLAPAPRASATLPTLRPGVTQSHGHAHGEPHDHGRSHQGGGHTHSEPPREAAEAGRPGLLDFRPAWVEGEAPETGMHRHGDTVHSHDAPAPTAELTTVRSIDDHRTPGATPVPSFPARAHLAADSPAAAALLIDLPVETPPPIGRG